MALAIEVERSGRRGNLLCLYGSLGSGQDQFHRPKGVAVDGDGRVFVADTGNNRVVVLSPWDELLVTYTEPNDGHAGAFSGPRDVAVEPDGDLVVVDSGNRRVVTVCSAAPAYSLVWLPAAMRAAQK